ncbi:hypothetical protein CAEBREN_18085 [Caenorhabditis brenneri]|uniref:Uncharacterized protein n=1 Tax=Caenorhabditis brenneri TaxID=135651 RepID=G0PG60_CAEBE|nr:hypothetical protein CAEBREN_18085 [Caenorhabditis brenneri]
MYSKKYQRGIVEAVRTVLKWPCWSECFETVKFQKLRKIVFFYSQLGAHSALQ